MSRLTNNSNYCEQCIKCSLGKLDKIFGGAYCIENFGEPCIEKNTYNKLKDYEDLEEQGLLLKLPCKVGDIIYEVDEAILLDDVIEPIKCKVTYILLKTEIHIDVEVIEGHGIGSTYTFELEDFGKTVFLTKEEAEKALERLECTE